jgi:hypothetical protein
MEHRAKVFVAHQHWRNRMIWIELSTGDWLTTKQLVHMSAHRSAPKKKQEMGGIVRTRVNEQFFLIR